MEPSHIPTCILRLHEAVDAYRPTLEEIRFLKNQRQFMKEMQKIVRFSVKDIQCLLLVYRRILNQCEKKRDVMTMIQFVIILHNTFNMTDDTMNHKIIQSFKTGQIVSMELWLRVMSLFLKGTLQEKIGYCFAVYDVRNNGFISKDIMMQFLRGSIITPQGRDDDEAVIDLIDIISKKMDLDRDGRISFEDYKQTVLNHPCLLEFLGQCLPDHVTCRKLLTTLMANVKIDIPTI